ncbi:MAG: ABC transporter permease [Deltaproteobacteria bacterium]|nr:ABC transporter permease [Deltaproteobacteria bacterium]MBW2693148.1 ABC transporter permease [Deltaproteobacteria bacterium]
MGSLNTLRQLIRDLRSQRLRTFLTTFGIVWGTIAVSLLLAFGEGLHHQMIKNAAGLGNGLVIAWPSSTSIPFEGMGRGREVHLDESDMLLLKQRSREIDALSSEYREWLILQQGSKRLSVDVSGVHPSYGEMRNVIPRAGGRFINPIDQRLKRRVAFLGNELAETLFGASDPVGQIIRIHASPFTIIGVMQPKIQQSSYSGRDKEKVIIPATTMQMLAGQKYLENFIFTARDIGRTQQASDEVLTILAEKHRFDSQDEEALMLWDTSEQAQFLNTFMFAFRLFVGIVGILTLVVGGIGVSNIMNVVVEERTREIGIKMALGAKPGSVLRQFMLETLVITGVGGLLGLGIAFGICSAVPALGFTDVIGVPTVSSVVAGTTALLLGLIGLVAGFFPARSAAAMDPVVAMKT